MIRTGGTASGATQSNRNESSTSSIRGRPPLSSSGRGVYVGYQSDDGVFPQSLRAPVQSTQSTSNESMDSSRGGMDGRRVQTGSQANSSSSSSSRRQLEGSASILPASMSIGAGSKQRKRSRTGVEDDTMSKEEVDEEEGKYSMEELLGRLETQIETMYKKGERGKVVYNKLATTEILRKIAVEDSKRNAANLDMATKLLESKEVIEALQKQVIELQHQLLETKKKGEDFGDSPYLNAVLSGTATAISAGRQLPLPQIPTIIKQAPAEKILIYKVEEKGEMASKSKQERFRMDLRTTLGDELIKDVSIIRPTRYGGHTIIFEAEEGRNKALAVIKENEEMRGIDETNSCLIAPKKKRAKVVCREPPEDYSIEYFLYDLYERHNPIFQQILRSAREAKVFITRLGWLIEFGTMETMAAQEQNGRIRYGCGRELKVEEFILLQQCYKYCSFGHSAIECRSELEWCRLCGKSGHSGKDCMVKDEKEKWRCANCAWKNESRGMKLNIQHGAAQLHKCPTALQQKEIKKSQLASAGVFTTPIIKEYLKGLNQGEGLRSVVSQREQTDGGRIGEGGASSASRRCTRTRSKSGVGSVSNTLGQRVIGPPIKSSRGRQVPSEEWQTVGRNERSERMEVIMRGRTSGGSGRGGNGEQYSMVDIQIDRNSPTVRQSL